MNSFNEKEWHAKQSWSHEGKIATRCSLGALGVLIAILLWWMK